MSKTTRTPSSCCSSWSNKAALSQRGLQLAERLAAVDRHMLKVRQSVAAADEAKVERARVAVAGDVERKAVHRDRHGVGRLEPRTTEVERLFGAGDVRDHYVEGR